MADSSKVHSVLALPPSTNKVKSQSWFDYKIPSTLENYIELVVKLIQYCCCNPCHHSLPYCVHFHCVITSILVSSLSSCNNSHLVRRIVRMLPALLLLLPVAFAIDCPEGWMGIHGSCYLVIIIMDILMIKIYGQWIWFDCHQTAPDKSMFFHAQEYCWEQGR